MSDQARAYVQKFSPYSGATFAVHYMIGDVANAEYEYRFFMATSNLAAKARVSFKSAQRALDQLCEDGFLVELKSSTQHAPTEYRFIFAKEKPVTYDPPKWASVDEIQTGQGDHPDEIQTGHLVSQTGHLDSQTGHGDHLTKDNQIEPNHPEKENFTSLQPDGVERRTMKIVAQKRMKSVEHIDNPQAYERKIMLEMETDGTLDQIRSMRANDPLADSLSLAESVDLHISARFNPQDKLSTALREHIKSVQAGGCKKCGSTYCVCHLIEGEVNSE